MEYANNEPKKIEFFMYHRTPFISSSDCNYIKIMSMSNKLYITEMEESIQNIGSENKSMYEQIDKLEKRCNENIKRMAEIREKIEEEQAKDSLLNWCPCLDEFIGLIEAIYRMDLTLDYDLDMFLKDNHIGVFLRRFRKKNNYTILSYWDAETLYNKADKNAVETYLESLGLSLKHHLK